MQIISTNTILYSRRFDECVRYYGEQLQWRVNMRNDWFVEFQVTDGVFVSIADESRATIASAGGDGLTLTFRVADADAAHRELVGRGVDVDRLRDHAWGARTFFVFDPEGRRIEFWSAASA